MITVPGSQREYRDKPGAAHTDVTYPDRFQTKDQRQRYGRHRFQEPVLRAEVQDAEAPVPEQKPEAEKNDRERQRRPLDHPRGEPRHGEHDGDQGEPYDYIRQPNPSLSMLRPLDLSLRDRL